MEQKNLFNSFVRWLNYTQRMPLSLAARVRKRRGAVAKIAKRHLKSVSFMHGFLTRTDKFT